MLSIIAKWLGYEPAVFLSNENRIVIIELSMLAGLLAFVTMLIIGVANAASCDQMRADDYKTTRAATEKLKRACAANDMSEKCTKAIEWGDKVLAKSNALETKCPSVYWSYTEPTPPWQPDEDD